MVDSLQIKEFVERIERLDGEQQTVGLDKKSVYDEAKKAGVNTKMLRRYISERKRDAKDSQTDKDALDAYRAALGEPGATYRSVAKKIGMPKSTLHRLVPNRENGTSIDTLARDAAGNPLQCNNDGVIIERADTDDELADEPGPEVDAAIEASTPGPHSEADTLRSQIPTSTDPETGELDTRPGSESGTAENEASPAPLAANNAATLRSQIPASTDPARLEREARRAEATRIAAEKEAEKQRRVAEREAERAYHAAIDADKLEIPVFLKRNAA